MSEAFLPIHIGLPKAGSTYLQHCVFPEMFPDAEYRPGGGTKLSGKATRAFLDGEDPPPGTLLSREKFSADQSGEPGSSWQNFENFLERARRLQTPARILFVIREHGSWLKSEWIDRCKKCRPVSTFPEFARNYTERDLDWSARIDALHELRLPLLVILQEDLARQPLATIALLCDFWDMAMPDSEAIEQRVRRSARANISPRTRTSLRVARAITRCEGPIRRILRMGRAFGVGRQANKRNVQDWAVRHANRLSAHSSRLVDELVVPPDLQARLDTDWARARQYASRPAE